MIKAFRLFSGILILLSAILPPQGQILASETPDAKIENRYIVVYKDSTPINGSVTDELEKNYEFRSDFRYSNSIRGFSALIQPEKLNKVKKDKNIAFITKDRTVDIDTSQPKSTISITAQTIPNGVTRIGLSATNEGSGIGVAILDTGIDLDHPDLSLNIAADKNCTGSTSSGNDDNGHGTAVAGTIAAVNNSTGVIGVAPQAKLISVKILDSKGRGSISGLICGIDWITSNAKEFNIKVANLSGYAEGYSDNNCGKTNNDALHLAICKSRNAGITYLAAAGNNAENAAFFIPAAYDDSVITVSALNDSDGQPGGYGNNTWDGNDDVFASFSNFGDAVDLGAPGVDILTTRNPGGYGRFSGTSLAAAHVSGAAALFLKLNPLAKWNEVRDGLVSIGEPLKAGHTDPSRLHPENVVKVNSL